MTTQISHTSAARTRTYDFHETVPVLPAAARRGPAVSQRGARLLGVVPHSDVHQGFRNSTTLSNRVRRLAGPGVARTARRQDDVVSGHGRSRPTCGCGPWSQRGSPPGGFANWNRASPRSPPSTSTQCSRRRLRRRSRLRRRVRRQVADGRHLRIDGCARTRRDQVRAWADGVMHRDDSVTDVPPGRSRPPEPDRLLPGDGGPAAEEADRRPRRRRCWKPRSTVTG